MHPRPTTKHQKQFHPTPAGKWQSSVTPDLSEKVKIAYPGLTINHKNSATCYLLKSAQNSPIPDLLEKAKHSTMAHISENVNNNIGLPQGVLLNDKNSHTMSLAQKGKIPPPMTCQ